MPPFHIIMQFNISSIKSTATLNNLKNVNNLIQFEAKPWGTTEAVQCVMLSRDHLALTLSWGALQNWTAMFSKSAK